ncbi:hypothetical protein DMC25_27045 [Caulobacter sp. D4A]|uniref:hypothetical protein n=1 Tax=unclassified Caulobacter TaxID=2648921 RepID=UPI000D7386B1|nr:MULTISPECIES: hypothetical protein [unclassified Caulobacter]PXA70409.1 hypothetical protein DMC25_27045 [Caulobacter sp. D4A]PXA96818.1 hypothetical protein DMC18_00720 [Caulobacter sp. D5]
MARPSPPSVAEINAAVDRWIAEARFYPPQRAAEMLRSKARFVAQQARALAGDAVALSLAETALLAAAMAV